MDRKAWIAIILCAVALFYWEWQNAKTRQAALAAQQAAALASPSPSATATPSIETPSAAQPAAAPTPATAAETRKLRSSVAEYTFTNVDGGIATVELLQHRAENGTNVIINNTSNIPIGAVAEEPANWPQTSYAFAAGDDSKIVLESTAPSGVKITKTFTLSPAAKDLKDPYQVRFDLTFSNPTGSKQDVRQFYISTGAAAPIHRLDQPRYTNFDYQAGSKTSYINVLGPFEAGRIPLIGIQTSAAKTEVRESPGDVLWAGTKNQYFATILNILDDNRGVGIWAARYDIPLISPDAQAHHGINGALGMPGFSLAPGETKTESFSFYSGPKEYSRLKKLGHEQDEVMEFGLFKIVSEFLLNALNWLHSVFKNYATSIIVLTLIIKTGLWTIQNKSMQSMKKMSLLAPRMTELKEKYKDDPTKMNQEMMKLYKEYGINPFAGCLPIFIQMPIFFGFYTMLAVAVELRNSSFLWVKDLSQPDTVAHVLGFPINLLPIVMALTMVWQMHITPKTGDAVQQRIFLFMPIIFLVFSYNYASALALYWTVQNIFSIVQLYLTRNQPMPELKKVSAAPAQPVLSGKRKR
ncbi:MAG TPA: membrane protein insertase YidC [Chthoniobacterales bacterium]